MTTIHNLNPGQFFEFRSPGYSFRKCLFVGKDAYGMMNFLHHTAGGDRFVLNNIPGPYSPDIEVNLPQDWTYSGNNYA